MKDRLDLRITLMMRFQISDQTAEQLSQKWLATHPGRTWSDLRSLILQDQVTYWNGELIDTSATLNSFQEPSTEIKYRGRAYPLSGGDFPQPPLPPKYVRRYRGKAY
ncbi:MAG: hypothetical protein VKK04_14245 [Synechococcales bacterium]|nr:hypothetical protein [Synechococcales bacterium]